MARPDPHSIRQLLVERARTRKAARRRAGFRRITRDDVRPSAKGVVDVLVLDEALTRLATLDPQQARIVELRYFGALTTKEIADAIGVATDTITSQWTMGRAWLKRAIDSAADDSSAIEL